MPPPTHQLLHQHAAGIRALAAGLLGAGEAEDVVQDTWVAAATTPPRDDRNRAGWLYVVARNAAFRRKRAERRRRAREEHVARPERMPSTAELAERVELKEHLIAALKSLREPYRSTLVLRYFDDLGPTAIARLQDIPVKTVKTRLHRGLAQLRTRLDDAYSGRRRAWALPLGAWVLPDSAVTAGAALTGGLAVKKIAVLLGVGLIGVLLFVLDPFGGKVHAPAESKSERGELTARREAALETNPRPEQRDAVAAPDRLTESDTVPAATWAGRVVSEAGTGIPGARVELVYYQPLLTDSLESVHTVLRRERERRDNPSTRTDADGYFRIDRPKGAQSFLRAGAEGFASAASGRHPAGTFTLITLRPDDGLRVHVTTADGTDVRGATVRLVTRTFPGTIPMSARQVLDHATTNARGVARVTVPPETGLQIEVVPVEGGLGLAEASVERGQGELDVVVPSVQAVKRRIVDATTGLPVPGAYVDVFQSSYKHMSFENEPHRRRHFADKDGWVTFPHQKGFYSQSASAPGYLVAWAWDEPIRLRRALHIEGTVLDMDGTPVPDAKVFICLPNGVFDRAYYGLSPVAAWSDANGRFAFDVKLPGPAHGDAPPDLGVRSVVALHPERAPAVVDSVAVVPGKTAEITLRFPAPASLAIELIDDAQKPLDGKAVMVSRVIPRAASWLEPSREWGVNFGHLLRRPWQKTDAEGHCLVEGLAPGEHIVRVQNTQRRVMIEEGKRASLRIVKGLGPGIDVRVVDATGEPVAKRHVNLSGPRAWVGVTDADGRFQFQDLPAGEYNVAVLVSGGKATYWASRTARPGQDVTLRLPAGPARLRISTDLPEDVALEFSLMTDAGGYEPKEIGLAPITSRPFVTKPFSPGTGILVVQAKGYGWTLVPFEAPEATTSDVSVSMRRSGSLTGRIEGALESGRHFVRLRRTDGWPKIAKRFEYAIRRSRGDTHYCLQPKKDGTFEFPDVNPGAYEAAYGRFEDRVWKQVAHDFIEIKSGEAASVVLTR